MFKLIDRTLFYIGSDGKLFTWTAVMQLAEQGLLDLHTDGFEEQLAALFVSEEADVLPLRPHSCHRAGLLPGPTSHRAWHTHRHRN